MFEQSVMSFVLRGWIVVSLLVLSGCGWLFGDDGVFRDRSDDYRQARLAPALTVPEDLSAEAIDDGFGIPPIEDESQLQGEFEVPRPDPLTQNVEDELVRIQRLGEEQWILVATNPGQLWPRLRGFLNAAAIGVSRADAVSGIIETAWLEPVNEQLLPERYRIRIEQGVQRGNSEIYVVQADRRAGEDWPRQSSNTEREALMVQELAQFLANNALAGSVSMLAQRAIDSEGKVFFKREPDRDPFLELLLTKDRAWASLSLALEKAGFEMTDLNRSQSRFWVRIDPNKDDVPEEVEDEGGFWSGLWDLLTWGDDEAEEGDPIDYVVDLQEQSAGIQRVVIAREDAAAMPTGEAEGLLKRIKRTIN